jgi:hypothetical protein
MTKPPEQVVAALAGLATTMPDGNVSTKFEVTVVEPPTLLEIMTVSVLGRPDATLVGLNAFATTGALAITCEQGSNKKKNDDHKMSERFTLQPLFYLPRGHMRLCVQRVNLSIERLQLFH